MFNIIFNRDMDVSHICWVIGERRATMNDYNLRATDAERRPPADFCNPWVSSTYRQWLALRWIPFRERFLTGAPALGTSRLVISCLRTKLHSAIFTVRWKRSSEILSSRRLYSWMALSIWHRSAYPLSKYELIFGSH